MAMSIEIAAKYKFFVDTYKILYIIYMKFKIKIIAKE